MHVPIQLLEKVVVDSFFFFFPFLCTFVIHGAPGWATDDAFNHTTALLRKTIDLVHS